MLPFQIGQLTGQAALGAGLPGAPTIGTATAGNAQASVTFTAPASNGGSAITGYTVTSSPGSFTGTGASSPIVVTGLTNGTGYTFTVTATNAVGTGPASSASNSVTPAPVFAVWDAANTAGATLSNGNLTVDVGGSPSYSRSTVGVSSGHWYWEHHIDIDASNTGPIFLGVTNVADNSSFADYYGNDGKSFIANAWATYGESYLAGAVIAFELNLSDGTLTAYKNNVSQGVMASGLTGTWYAHVASGSSVNHVTVTTNYGASAFTYTPPTGYVGLSQ